MALLSAVFRLDEDFWQKDEERQFNEQFIVRYKLVERFAKETPERAAELNGLNAVFLGIHIMEDACEGVRKKAALRFMNTFAQIYREDPDICDIDALIRFIK